MTEEKQKNQIAKKNATEQRFIKTIIIITITMGGAITRCPSPLCQRCTAATDGNFQGGHSEQTNAVESID